MAIKSEYTTIRLRKHEKEIIEAAKKALQIHGYHVLPALRDSSDFNFTLGQVASAACAALISQINETKKKDK